MSLDNAPDNPNTPEQSQLGRASAYADKYDASLLFPISRATQREAMGITGGALPFFGADLWTAFEVSWLNLRGKPQLAIAHFTIPCETPNIIESKSFKLYLNSFNSTAFASLDAVRDRLRTDLSEALWRGSDQSAGIGVKLLAPDMFDREPVHELDGLSLDRLDMDFDTYSPEPTFLSAALDEAVASGSDKVNGLAERLWKLKALAALARDQRKRTYRLAA